MGKKQTVDALVDGGKASAGPPIGSSLGPLKVNIGQVVAEINQKTKDFAGMKVPVKIIVDTEDKTFTITIGTPPASQLIKKEIGIESCSGEPHVNKIGAITFEQIIKVARMKQSSLIVNNLKSAVKTIAGSCQSSGILIDGKDAIEILKEIDNGNYDDLIKNEKTEPSAEKKKQMADLTKELLSKSESRKKEKAAAKAAAEAAAAAQATAAPATGTTPAATPGAKTAAPAKDAKPAPAAKKTEKK
ncbi:50S ribosomal protein L11 [Candidatus Woesearchaeota archaeon]|nr:50S ribosomal protein L11 [Candidatus Woesearchaeota archaeon]